MGVEAPPAAADASPAPSFQPLQAMVALGGIQALTMLAGLIRSKILAVMLGPAGVGVAGVVDQAVSLVAQLGSLSVPFVALKFLSRARDASSHDVRRVYTALLGTIGLCSVVSAAIATVIAAWRPGIFGDGRCSASCRSHSPRSIAT
jgi:O-antigen/teichoic acid export membrane protein